MSELKLKPLSPQAIPAALAKAERYRLLNEPGEAESICRDVLLVDARNQQALTMLILSLTDQLDREDSASFASEARELVAHLDDEYARAYYAGIICERRAKALIKSGRMHSGFAAFEWLKEALAHFEKALELRPAGNEEATLRWNACIRRIERHPDVRPRPESPSEPILSE